VPRFRYWLLPLALLLANACDRLAGTEVGNPEITVAARFALRDTAAGVSIPEMSLKCMGLGYSMPGDSGTLWDNPNGYMVDFAAGDSEAVPLVKVHEGNWSQAEMMLQSPAGDSSLPDSQGYEAWGNPRYTKLVKVMGADTVRFLFEMPAGMRIKLMFGKGAVAAWQRDHRMTATILFDGGAWARGAGSDTAGFVWRRDGKHARYVLLSPGENAGAYASLKALLPSCFMADSAEML
jgi:hypothetical protein